MSYKKLSLIIVSVIVVVSALTYVLFRGFGRLKPFIPNTHPNGNSVSSVDDLEHQRDPIITQLIEAGQYAEYDISNDKDADGVSDDKEKELGTDIYGSDSDGDGLLDKDEIERWKTDPKKTDSDGDGFWDGFEIMNGYNPNGEGKLSQ